MRPVILPSVPMLVVLISFDWGSISASKAKRSKPQSKAQTSHYYHYSNYDGNSQQADTSYYYGGGAAGDTAKDYRDSYVNYGVISPVDSYDYGGEQAKEPLQCYACHYHVEHGHPMGEKACNDPFVGTTIPDVSCTGPCGKLYRQLANPGEFMISRACMPACKESQTLDSYVQCCSTPLCNSAETVRRRPSLFLCAFVLPLLALLFRR